MRPSKAAIKAAGEAFVKWETIENMLKAAYVTQFGNEPLYREPERCLHRTVTNGKCDDCGAIQLWVVPIGGDDG